MSTWYPVKYNRGVFKLIIVHNRELGRIYGFQTLADYKQFATNRDNAVDYCWYDAVYDVGTGGVCTIQNQVDLTEFNIDLDCD